MLRKRYPVQHKRTAQTAVEYLLLLAVVVGIVLVGFKTFVPRTRDAGQRFFNRTTISIVGAPNRCGDRTCDGAPYEDGNSCCMDCAPGCGNYMYGYANSSY